MTSKSTRKSVAFKAQARTIDHLGKGQIADAPTAVSELWKNSYDAYSRDVALHLFDGKTKCGSIIDNGCGMSYEQLSNSWLTIGTSSKSKKQLLPEEDRFGLNPRFTQGEKGIGRLSTAFLAPVTLIVTKKIDSRYSVALIDWRLFENTYLGLHQIKVPMDEFDDLAELPDICNALQSDLLGNLALSPSPDDIEENIIRAAWENFSNDELEVFENRSNKHIDDKFVSTSKQIQNLCESFSFQSDYLLTWEIILDKVKELDGKSHGTALFLLDLNRDLDVLTNRGELDREAPEYLAIEEDLIDTLRSFADPYERASDDESTQFHYEIKAFDSVNSDSKKEREVLNYKDVFNYQDFSNLEHKVEGFVDKKGWFRGKVTAWGKEYLDIEIPCRSSGMGLETKTGEFGLKIGSFEGEISMSSLSVDAHSYAKEQAEKYSGFMIFRDGLRVLPYGRVDNDFFEIEERRGKNAGRYYWASRRIFAQVKLNQNDNPNLKDKAGREGFIKNQAARELKSLVTNLLLALADNYFGRYSDNRKTVSEQVSKDKKKKNKAHRDSVQEIRERFLDTLSENESVLNEQVKNITMLQEELDADIHFSLNHLDELVHKIESIEVLKPQLKTPNKPTKLDDSLEGKYRYYRDQFAALSELLQTCREKLNYIETKYQYIPPIQSVEKKYKKSEIALTKMVNRYNGLIELKINDVQQFWIKEARKDRKSYESQALPILDAVSANSDAVTMLNNLDSIYTNLADDISYKYESFLQALEKLEKGIDLDSAFVIAAEERENSEKEVNQIRSLAQLGISFEVLSHELHGQDQTVTRALNSMSTGAKQEIGFKNALQAHKQFTAYLRFLSPLKLSGYQPRTEIKGSDVVKYIDVFFRDRFVRQNVELQISDSFKNMSINDVPSRIQPVFINILNNAIYWVGLSESRTIKIDIVDDLVVIANSGPAVDQDDIERLFELFYSRRTNGNGVGLYLSKQNLAVARHKIWYVENPEHKLIQDGANFAIKFRNMEVK